MIEKIKNKKGVTLLELIVVIAIIGIMTSVALVSLSKSRDVKAVEVAARDLAAAIRETQNYALSGKNIGTSVQLPCRWRINRVSNVGNEDKYRIWYFYNNPGNNTCPDSNAILFKTANFSAGSKVDANSDDSFVLNFNVPFGGLVISGVNSNAITITRGTATHNVCVYSSGKIFENGTAACPAM